jgi:hypothetical protein
MTYTIQVELPESIRLTEQCDCEHKLRERLARAVRNAVIANTLAEEEPKVCITNEERVRLLPSAARRHAEARKRMEAAAIELAAAEAELRARRHHEEV